MELFTGNSGLFDDANIVKKVKSAKKSRIFEGMEERTEHIRKRPGMYIGRLGSGANEQDGIYNLLKIVFYSLIRQFREGISDELTISIHDGKNVKISYPSTEIGYMEIVQALSSSFEIADDGYRAILSFTPDEAIFDFPVKIQIKLDSVI